MVVAVAHLDKIGLFVPGGSSLPHGASGGGVIRGIGGQAITVPGKPGPDAYSPIIVTRKR